LQNLNTLLVENLILSVIWQNANDPGWSCDQHHKTTLEHLRCQITDKDKILHHQGVSGFAR